MSDARRTQPPSGMQPPRRAEGPNGVDLDLEALASEVCSRYYQEFTDEDERYSDAGRAWCQHDNQHLLNWAADSVQGYVDLDREVSWLARVLEAVDGGEAIADALTGVGARVRERGTFLD